MNNARDIFLIQAQRETLIDIQRSELETSMLYTYLLDANSERQVYDPFLLECARAFSARSIVRDAALKRVDEEIDLGALGQYRREAETLLAAGQEEQALAALHRVLSLDPANKVAAAQRAPLLLAQCARAFEAGEIDAAWEALRACLLLVGETPAARALTEQLQGHAEAQGRVSSAAIRTLRRFLGRSLRCRDVFAYRSPVFPSHLYRFDIDADGMIYALDSSQNCIHCIAEDGVTQRMVGKFGKGELEFDGATDILVLKDHLIVSEFGNNRLQVLDKRGGFVRFISGLSSTQPRFWGGLLALEKSQDGGFYLLEVRSCGVHRFDAAFNYLYTCRTGTPFIPLHDSRLSSIAWCDANNILYASDHRGRVFVFDEQGKILDTFQILTNGAKPRDVTALGAVRGELLLFDPVFDLTHHFLSGVGSKFVKHVLLHDGVKEKTLVHARFIHGRNRFVCMDKTSSFYFFELL